MAHHSQQQKIQRQSASRDEKQQANDLGSAPFQNIDQNSESNCKDNTNSIRGNVVSHQQLEQNGKRSLIKNQLYLIEQLQLENASLRNERDQLQLENEELKFQLQMISSSNILHQTNATFDNQQLERLVDNETNKQAERFDASSNEHALDLARPTADRSPATTTILSKSHQAFPVSIVDGHTRLISHESNPTKLVPCEPTILRELSQASDPKCQLFKPNPVASLTDIDSCVDADQQSAKLVVEEGPILNSEPLDRDLPRDEEEERVKLVEQRYGGDSELVQASAVIIQRAFRKYQICKRFRTITEKLRHTHQAAAEQRRQRAMRHEVQSAQAASWESLSQAANRLAVVAKQQQRQQQQQQQQQQHIVHEPNQTDETQSKTSDHELVEANPSVNRQMDKGKEKPTNPVVAAVINFQQLESIRKRQYRVGLNVFNKNPEKGISFLIAHSFIDSSSPVSKTSNGYYHSNQLHFIDSKQHSLQQSLSSPLTMGGKLDNVCVQGQFCKFCLEEEYLKQNVARFLLHRKGLAKEKIGQYLGNLQSNFNQDVLRYYLSEMDFHGLQVDIALRKFLSSFRLPGEAQKIERMVDMFAKRYVACQQSQPNSIVPNGVEISAGIKQSRSAADVPGQLSQSKLEQKLKDQHANLSAASNYKNNLSLLSKDEIFILTFAIIMLNTDLHSPSLKPTSRMSTLQFINNLRGVFKSQTIVENDLIEIYERVKANQISTTPDHVSHVMKVQQGLTVTNFQKKELPNLCVPHRRLVCFCRLFEVYDVNKKERVGQHQREIFLFNDLLLVTKLARRVRANANQLYTYRQSISLQGLYVQLFQSTHYNFGIRLCQRSNDEMIIMFNARNELDRSRFVDDLGESIAEMDEMETIRHHNIIDAIHFKHLEKLRRHSLMHNVSLEEHHRKRNSKIMNSCDSTHFNNINLADPNPVKDHQSEERCGQQRNQCSHGQNLAPTKLAASNKTSVSIPKTHAKFSSMMNLSSSLTDDPRVTLYTQDNDAKKHCASKNLRQNQSYVLQQSQKITDNRVASHISGDNEQQSAILQQRRSSASSVHSLDSGLFLSRDVSPNQSN